MSDFWELWHKAEKGDTAAAHQCNVLVAKRAGLNVDTLGEHNNWRPAFTLDRELVDTWYTDTDGQEHPIPDFMSDLNAAAGLPIPNNFWFKSQGYQFNDHLCVTEIFHPSGGRGNPGVCLASSEARARVGAWWAVVTGEKQPE